MVSQKVVIPAKAGIHGISSYLKRVDSRFHGYDEQTFFQTFCAGVKTPYIKIPCGLAAGNLQ